MIEIAFKIYQETFFFFLKIQGFQALSEIHGMYRFVIFFLFVSSCS